MQCEEARELLSAARYGAAPGPLEEAARAHVAACAECRAAQAAQDALDGWLASDEPALPGPGFDTRFFARLSHERSGERRRRWARLGFALVPVAAAAAVALVVLRRAEPEMPSPEGERPVVQDAPDALGVAQEDLDLALDLELVESLEVVQRIDELEAFEALADVDERELEALLEEAP